MFVPPAWVDLAALDRLINEGYLSCVHRQHDAGGVLLVAMGLNPPPKGIRLIRQQSQWRSLAVKGSLAVASFAVMSIAILYLG
jgi:hypothetical protein